MKTMDLRHENQGLVILCLVNLFFIKGTMKSYFPKAVSYNRFVELESRVFFQLMFFLNLGAFGESVFIRKRIRDASIYTSKKISLKFLFLSDIFLFPFVRQ